MAKSVKVEWWLLKNPPVKRNTNKFSLSDDIYTKIGDYINNHLRFKREFMNTKSKHLIAEKSVVFSNAISHSVNQLFPVNVGTVGFPSLWLRVIDGEAILKVSRGIV